jgi:hypothetical protein
MPVGYITGSTRLQFIMTATGLYLRGLKVCEECVESSTVNYIFGISILSLHLHLIHDSGRKEYRNVVVRSLIDESPCAVWIDVHFVTSLESTELCVFSLNRCVQVGPGIHPASYLMGMGKGLFPSQLNYSGHVHLMPRWRMPGAINPLTIHFNVMVPKSPLTLHYFALVTSFSY